MCGEGGEFRILVVMLSGDLIPRVEEAVMIPFRVKKLNSGFATKSAPIKSSHVWYQPLVKHHFETVNTNILTEHHTQMYQSMNKPTEVKTCTRLSNYIAVITYIP